MRGCGMRAMWRGDGGLGEGGELDFGDVKMNHSTLNVFVRKTTIYQFL